MGSLKNKNCLWRKFSTDATDLVEIRTLVQERKALPPDVPNVERLCTALAPARSDGTIGESIALVTNHFAMTVPNDAVVFRYDVDVTLWRGWIQDSLTGSVTDHRAKRTHDKLESRRMCYALYEKLFIAYRNTFKNRYEVFYDGSRNLSPLATSFMKINGDEAVMKIRPCQPLYVNASDIVSGFAGNFIDFDRTALQIFDLITSMRLNLNLGKENYSQFGQFYFTPLGAVRLGAGKQLYDGLFKYVRPVTVFGSMSEPCSDAYR
ncbi:unnamed protein product [Soboliphyme baturini]|uniref:Phospholipid scramblase n=1 Tax=Soboliphyme baturini TaxID=241478 RepID=A0A183J6P3_9BILA|nr:unnamed protein product [Soboliphyme baturini]